MAMVIRASRFLKNVPQISRALSFSFLSYTHAISQRYYDFPARHLDKVSFRRADCFFVEPDVPVLVTARIADLLFILDR